MIIFSKHIKINGNFLNIICPVVHIKVYLIILIFFQMCKYSGSKFRPKIMLYMVPLYMQFQKNSNYFGKFETCNRKKNKIESNIKSEETGIYTTHFSIPNYYQIYIDQY